MGETSSQAWTTRWLAHNLWDKQVRRESPKACVGWISQMLALPGCKVQCLATCFPIFPNNKNQKVYQPAIRNLLSMCRARVAFFLVSFCFEFCPSKTPAANENVDDRATITAFGTRSSVMGGYGWLWWSSTTVAAGHEHRGNAKYSEVRSALTNSLDFCGTMFHNYSWLIIIIVVFVMFL